MIKFISFLFCHFFVLTIFNQALPTQPLSGPGGSNYLHNGVNMHDFTNFFGSDGYWLFEPTSPTPDSADVIIFNHAYGVFNPGPYGAWIEHLVKRGNIVIFPKFQNSDGSLPSTYTSNAVTGIQDAIIELNTNSSYVKPRWQHLAMIGHSYGGVISANIGVEYASYGIPKPDCIMLCQPGTGGINTGRLASYAPMNTDYNMLIIVGNDDVVVGDAFGWEIMDSTSILTSRKNLIVHYADNYGNGNIEASHNEPLAADNTYDGGVTSIIIASAYGVSKIDPVDHYCYWKLADALMSCTFYGNDCNYAFGDTDDQKNMGLWGDGTPAIPLVVFPASTATASCKNINAYLDNFGTVAIQASDINNNSSSTSPPLNYTISQSNFTCNDLMYGATSNDMIITGVIDGPLTGGTPKALELYVLNNISDLSQFGMGSANNGGGTDGQEFTFPAIQAFAGQYIYISYDSSEFSNWFGFSPDYTAGFALINGDDAMELFYMGNVIDVFGDINLDGNGEPWEYMNGWAYRNNETGPDGTAFNLGNWNFSGPNALNGETSNSTAIFSFPAGSYVPIGIGQIPVTLIVNDQSGIPDSCQSIITVLDTITPSLTCPGDQSISCDSLMPNFTALGLVTDNCSSSLMITQAPLPGIIPTGMVTLTATDFTGNSATCTFNLFITDTTAPIITCPLDQDLTFNASCQYILPDYTSSISSTDNCDPNPILSQSPIAGSILTTSGIVTITSADIEGNSSTCTFNVFIDSSTSFINDTACNSYTAPDTLIYTSSGQYTAIIPNSIGCDSTIVINLTIHNSNSGSESVNSCYSYIWAADGNTYSSNGVYTTTLTNIYGCDSTATLNLTIISVDINVTQAGIQLTANANGGSYRWLECIAGIPNGFSIISGQTNQSFTATTNGSYAVEVTLNGCVDTSICYTISNVGINPHDKDFLIVYPNPSKEIIYLSSSIPLNNATILIMDANGKIVVKEIHQNGTDFNFNLKNTAKGIYFIEILNAGFSSTIKVFKQ